MTAWRMGIRCGGDYLAPFRHYFLSRAKLSTLQLKYSEQSWFVHTGGLEGHPNTLPVKTSFPLLRRQKEVQPLVWLESHSLQGPWSPTALRPKASLDQWSALMSQALSAINSRVPKRGQKYTAPRQKVIISCMLFPAITLHLLLLIIVLSSLSE